MNVTNALLFLWLNVTNMTVNVAAEHPYDLALYHELMSRHLVPKFSRIFAIAQQGMQIVAEADPNLYRHMMDIAQLSPTLDTKVTHGQTYRFLLTDCDFYCSLVQITQLISQITTCW